MTILPSIGALLRAGLAPRMVGRCIRWRALLALRPELASEQTPETCRLLWGVWLVTSGRCTDCVRRERGA